MEYTEEEKLLLEILEDEDVIWDWNLWKSDDPLVLWLVGEKLARCESLDILGYNEENMLP
jgi:hypothetical protein